MVKGLDRFREFFKDFEDQYVLIGGAACDILFASNRVHSGEVGYNLYHLPCEVLHNRLHF